MWININCIYVLLLQNWAIASCPWSLFHIDFASHKLLLFVCPKNVLETECLNWFTLFSCKVSILRSIHKKLGRKAFHICVLKFHQIEISKWKLLRMCINGKLYYFEQISSAAAKFQKMFKSCYIKTLYSSILTNGSEHSIKSRL